jgi:anti-anti-sigma factor
VEIGESRDGEVFILAPSGSLNTQTSPKLEQKLLKLLEEKARLVVIDFKGVDYLSSAALRVLLMTLRRLVRAQGRLVLCTMGDDLRKVFSISGFDRDFTILQTRGEAVALAATTPAPPAKAETKPAKAPKSTKAEASPEPKVEAPPKAAGAPGWPFAAAPATAAPAPHTAERRLATEASAVPEPVAALAPPVGAAIGRVLAHGESTRPAWASWPAGPGGPAVAALAAKIAATLAKGL